MTLYVTVSITVSVSVTVCITVCYCMYHLQLVILSVVQIKYSRVKSKAKNIYDNGSVCDNFLEVVCGPVPPRYVWNPVS